jgi:polyhydroxybutyrate depolymerase
MASAHSWSQRIGRIVVALLTLNAMPAACADQAPSAGAPSSLPPSSAVMPSATASPPAASASPAADLVVGGARPVTVHIPASYDPARPAPMLILLHGFTASGEEVDSYFNLGPAAEARGFVYAYPDGTFDADGNRFWNATDACCNFSGADVDDVAYLTDVIDETSAELAIDPKRIAFVGHSNGGFMSYRMACERADRVAAIVSLAGATYADPAGCAPSESVSVLQIHGRYDDTILYEGGSIDVPYPGAQTTAETWATYDGCDGTASMLTENVDVDADRADGDDPAESSVREWSGCESEAAVQLWTIPFGSHAPTLSQAFPDAVMDFLVNHPKP